MPLVYNDVGKLDACAISQIHISMASLEIAGIPDIARGCASSSARRGEPTHEFTCMLKVSIERSCHRY